MKKIEYKIKTQSETNKQRNMNKSESFLPPSPPTEIQEKKRVLPNNGTFEYITDLGDRRMLATAYKAITLTENWDFIKQNPKDIFSTPEIYLIDEKINELGYSGHSGSSFTAIIRVMQFIAKYGEAKFREDNQK